MVDRGLISFVVKPCKVIAVFATGGNLWRRDYQLSHVSEHARKFICFHNGQLRLKETESIWRLPLVHQAILQMCGRSR